MFLRCIYSVKTKGKNLERQVRGGAKFSKTKKNKRQREGVSWSGGQKKRGQERQKKKKDDGVFKKKSRFKPVPTSRASLLLLLLLLLLLPRRRRPRQPQWRPRRGSPRASPGCRRCRLSFLLRFLLLLRGTRAPSLRRGSQTPLLLPLLPLLLPAGERWGSPLLPLLRFLPLLERRRFRWFPPPASPPRGEREPLPPPQQQQQHLRRRSSPPPPPPLSRRGSGSSASPSPRRPPRRLRPERTGRR